ncbi:hypothetical protein [Ornithinimicrobium avium]|nr:hypothetical protein [Ornithinimicrobium avium]
MQPHTTVIGFLGASGGLGTSSLACAVARLCADVGTPTLLVDLAPGGGGLDQLAGLSHEPGLRWPMHDREVLALPAGRLPAQDGLRVLSHPGPRARPATGEVTAPPSGPARPLGPAALEAVARLARGQGATVLDLPRADHPEAPAWWDLCYHLVLLSGTAPSQVSAALAARELLATGLGLVARPAPGFGLDPHDVAGLVGLPLLDRLPHDPTVAQALAEQEPPGTREGPLRATACTVLARVAELDRGAA